MTIKITNDDGNSITMDEEEFVHYILNGRARMRQLDSFKMGEDITLSDKDILVSLDLMDELVRNYRAYYCPWAKGEDGSWGDTRFRKKAPQDKYDDIQVLEDGTVRITVNGTEWDEGQVGFPDDIPDGMLDQWRKLAMASRDVLKGESIPVSKGGARAKREELKEAMEEEQ